MESRNILRYTNEFIHHRKGEGIIVNPHNPLVPIRIHLDLLKSMGTVEKSDLEGSEEIQNIWDSQTDGPTDRQSQV